MADIQIEDGKFTQIANILLEKTSAAKLNGCQYAIVLQVWRYTYGFKRKEHELSAGFLAKATGFNKRQIERELNALVERHIINQRTVNGVSRTLAFNKDFETWDKTPGELADGKEADGKLTDGEKADTPPANKPTVTPGELADQEIKSFKQNSKESKDIVPYAEIIDYLNLKAGTNYKSSTRTTKEHINGRWHEGFRLEDFKIVIDKKTDHWLGDPANEQYLRPQTLFNSEKFESYLNQKIVIKGGGSGGKYKPFSTGREEADRRAADIDADLFIGTPTGPPVPEMSGHRHD